MFGEADLCLLDCPLVGRGTSQRNGTWTLLGLPADVSARWGILYGRVSQTMLDSKSALFHHHIVRCIVGTLGPGEQNCCCVDNFLAA